MECSFALLTDLYELTMIGGYFREGRHRQPVAFDYFFRVLPGQSGFAVFAGLDDLSHRLQALRFGDEEIRYLETLSLFEPAFLEALREFRFTGDIHAAREGTVVFPYEPLVRVVAELWEAQLIETLLLNSLNYPTLVATKAARVCLAAGSDPVIEFGLRRAQGPDGGVSGTRAAFVGGCVGTSNVEAGRRFGIPVKGTHAHSWVMSYPDERAAFRAYVAAYPTAPTLLVDTYDTVNQGIPNAIQVFQEMRRSGWQGRPSIRLDSGDLAADSIIAYERFVEAGFPDPLIIASNDLDEYQIADLKARGARVNAWGVGTNLIVSADCPALGGVYKLAAVQEQGAWVPKLKVSGSAEKTTDPGLKAVVRYYSSDEMAADVLFCDDEDAPSRGPITGVDRTLSSESLSLMEDVTGEPLLQPFLENGCLVEQLPSLTDTQSYAREQIAKLPEELRRLHDPKKYPVLLSERLAERKRALLTRHGTGHLPASV